MCIFLEVSKMNEGGCKKLKIISPLAIKVCKGIKKITKHAHLGLLCFRHICVLDLSTFGLPPDQQLIERGTV